MPSFSRRKVPLNNSTKRNGFLGLPDDILILIFGQCCIDELLALRLISSRTRTVIDAYQSTIAPSVARSTFPHSNLLLRPLEDGSDRSLRWLLALIPRQLAAILVDRHCSHSGSQYYRRHNIPAEQAYGDELRARVANGWHVLHRMSNISREVHSAHTNTSLKSSAEILDRIIHPLRCRLEGRKQVDDAVLQRRLEYTQHLPQQAAEDYRLMMFFLSCVFNTAANKGPEYSPWIFDWGVGLDGPRSIRHGESWLTWLILDEGPDMFWRQWWSLPHEVAGNYIRDHATKVFKALPYGLAEHQRTLAKTVHDAVYAKIGKFDAWNPFRYFQDWEKIRNEQEEQWIEPVKTLEHVPFMVKFRRPEAWDDRDPTRSTVSGLRVVS